MIAGLPGTGIGGLFYFVLTLLMPFRELYRNLRGKSTPGRWSFIALQLGFVAAICGGMWGEVWLIGRLFEWMYKAAPTAAWTGVVTQTKMMSFIVPCGALISLALVLIGFFVLRFFVNLNSKSRVISVDNSILREAA